MRSIVLMACALAGLAALPNQEAAQVDPRIFGTWTLNLARSVYRLGPPPLAQTQVFEPSRNGLKVTVETVAGPGVRISYGYAAELDGREYPLEGDLTPNGAETISLVAVDPLTIDATLRQARDVVLTTRIQLSSDGRVLTLTSRGTNRYEQPTHSITVFERQ